MDTVSFIHSSRTDHSDLRIRRFARLSGFGKGDLDDAFTVWCIRLDSLRLSRFVRGRLPRGRCTFALRFCSDLLFIAFISIQHPSDNLVRKIIGFNVFVVATRLPSPGKIVMLKDRLILKKFVR